MRPTDNTAPLRIEALPVANGLVGLFSSPLGTAPSGATIETLTRWGATAVLILTGDRGPEAVPHAQLQGDLEASSIPCHRFSMPAVASDAPAPPPGWRDLSPKLHRVLEHGGRLVVLGDAGPAVRQALAALILVGRGKHRAEAIRELEPLCRSHSELERWKPLLELHDAGRSSAGLQLRASLIGGAIGDSLGADIEFMSLSAIRDRFPEGLTDLPPHQGLRGAITDDTQMTMFTAEGIIRARKRAMQKGICHVPSVVHHALLRWLKTQGHTPRIRTDDTGLIADTRLWARRAPGITCLSALERSPRFGAPAVNDSKGCGTIMRVAPVALMTARDRVRDTAMDTSALTHGHRTGQLAAAAWAEMLAEVHNGGQLQECAEHIAHEYARLEDGDETVRAIHAALDAPRDGEAETVEALGGGWVAEEALSIALYACLCGRSFEDMLTIAVLHGGDSDSTGAIAGNMAGLLDPMAVLQHRWASVVEGADILTRLADDYLRISHEPDGLDDGFHEFHPGC